MFLSEISNQIDPDIVKNFEMTLSGFPESDFSDTEDKTTDDDLKISNELKKLGYI